MTSTPILAQSRWKTWAKSLLMIRPAYNLFSRDYWFGQVDSRPLGVFRIVFALLVLKDAIYTLPLARIFYSDEGVTPRSALWDGLARSNRFSLLDAMPYPWMVTGFLLLWIVVLLMLLVGYQTRWATILNALLIVSLHERNPFVLSGADTVFRVLSLWSIFLPLGHYYSIDALRDRLRRYRVSRHLGDLRAPNQAKTSYAFPLRMAQIQIAIVYFFTGILKLPGGASAWANGEALHYALQLKSHTLPTGDWMSQLAPDFLLRWVDYQTLFTEIAFPLLVFSPVFQPALRLLALALGTLLHGGIAATMSIGNFSMVMICSYLLFFQPEWIVRAGAALRRIGQPISIGVPPPGSPLWLLLAATRNSEIAINGSVIQLDESADGWHVEDSAGHRQVGRYAWVLAASHLPLSRMWVWALRLKFVRSACWLLLSAYSRRAIVPAPDDIAAPYAPLSLSRRVGRWSSAAATGLVTLILAALMIIIIRWNLSSANFLGLRLGQPVTPFEADAILFTGFWQNWAMFAPFPTLYDGWVIIPGTFEDGTVLDLRTGKPVSLIPYRVYFGPDVRWKKYENNLMDYRYDQLLKAWGAYYCQQYNVNQNLPEGHRLATLQIVFRGRVSYAPGEAVNPYQEWPLWNHWCLPQ